MCLTMLGPGRQRLAYLEHPGTGSVTLVYSNLQPKGLVHAYAERRFRAGNRAHS